MKHVFQIAILSCAGLVLTGCNGPEESDALWQGVKIGDVAPSAGGKQPAGQLLKTINFDVYIFEIPAENISKLNDVWQALYTKPLRFDDYDAFGANSFLASFGQIQMWNKIADLLRDASGKKVDTVSLLLPDGQTSDLPIAGLDSEQTIFYISSAGLTEGANIGPGRLSLRIKAEKIPGLRGVCKMSALPVFLPPIRSLIPRLAVRAKSGEFLFSCCRFELEMSPGDFVFLGPEKYVRHQISLGGLFFSRPRRKPVVRTYLIFCRRIID